MWRFCLLFIFILMPYQALATSDSLCMDIDGSVKIIYYEKRENVCNPIWMIDENNTDYVLKDTLIQRGNIRIITDSVDIILDWYSLLQEFNYESLYSMCALSMVLIDTFGRFDLIVARNSIAMIVKVDAIDLTACKGKE